MALTVPKKTSKVNIFVISTPLVPTLNHKYYRVYMLAMEVIAKNMY